MNHAMKLKDQHSFWVAGLIILIFLLFGNCLFYVNKTPVYLLPAPSRILKTLFENPLMYLEASMVTLGEAIVGLVIGVIAGILSGIDPGSIARSRRWRDDPGDFYQVHPAGCDCTTSDVVARVRRVAKNNHHRLANLLSGARQYHQRYATGRPCAVGFISLLEFDSGLRSLFFRVPNRCSLFIYSFKNHSTTLSDWSRGS